MKHFRRIYLITLGVLSLALGVIAMYEVHEFWGQVVMLGGMMSGALAMFLIALVEAFPKGLYLVNKKSNKEIRVL